MEQCWDADLTKRPDMDTFFDKIQEISQVYCQNFNLFKLSRSKSNNLEINKINNLEINYTSISKVYQFEDLLEPRNATEGNII